MKKVIMNRKRYSAPKLTVYGSITELTQASGSGVGDNELLKAMSGTG